MLPFGSMLQTSHGERTPREGAGQLPVLLLDQGQLPYQPPAAGQLGGRNDHREHPPRLVEERKLMMIERQIGRTLAGAPKKSRETTLGPAEVLALALTVGLGGFCVALILFMIAFI